MIEAAIWLGSQQAAQAACCFQLWLVISPLTEVCVEFANVDVLQVMATDT